MEATDEIGRARESKPIATGIDRLSSVGLTDHDIVELVHLIGYYNCVNRVAVGLALR